MWSALDIFSLGALAAVVIVGTACFLIWLLQRMKALGDRKGVIMCYVGLFVVAGIPAFRGAWIMIALALKN